MDIRHVAYSTKLMFKAEIALSTCLDDYTVNSKHLCLPAFMYSTVSISTYLFMKIATIAENFFHGMGVLVTFPFSGNAPEKTKRSWKILKEVPSDIKELFLSGSLGTIIMIGCALGEPKLLIVQGVETAEVYRKHFEKNTVGTKEFYEELDTIGARSKEGLLAWQSAEKSYLKNKKPKNIDIEKCVSKWLIKNVDRRHEFQIESKE